MTPTPMSRSKEIVASILRTESELHYPTAESGWLVLESGDIFFDVSFSLPPREPGKDGDDLIVTLDVADRMGAAYRLARRLPASVLLDVLRVSSVTTVGTGRGQEAQLLIEGIVCFADGRDYTPAVASVEGEAKAFAYWQDHLHLRVDLLKRPTRVYLGRDGVERDELLLRAHPAAGKAIGGDDAPLLVARTFWAPMLALWPYVLNRFPYRSDIPAVFHATGERREAQPLVRLEPA